MSELKPAGKFVEVPSWMIPAATILAIVLSVAVGYQAFTVEELQTKVSDLKAENRSLLNDRTQAWNYETELTNRLRACKRFK